MVRTPGLSLSTAFPDLFRNWNEWFNEPAWPERSLTVPAVNITETDKAYSLSVAAPGLKREEFNVDVDGNTLTISAEQQESHEEKETNYNRCEYNYSSFSRSFVLPDDVKQDAIEAAYMDGVLQVTIPKKEVVQKPAAKVAVK